MDTSSITAWPHRQRGLSIVEILLAMALSLILTLVVSQIYLGSKQTYLLQEAQSRLQENGRFALQILAKDIRRAGNMGCLSIKKTPVVLAKPTPDITPATSIMGYNAKSASDISSYPVSDQTYSKTNWAPDAPDIGTAESGKLKAIAGTDIFTIQFAESCGGGLRAGIEAQSSTASILNTNTCSIQAGSDELVLSDCRSIDIFRADSVSTNNITSATDLTITTTNNNNLPFFSSKYYMDAEVMVFHSHTYFIRMFNDEPTLYRRENTEITPTPQPLIEGVENMQVLYGIDKNPDDGSADGSVDRYLTANNVPTTDWANVIAVRIDLVLRSTGEEGKYLTSTPTTTTTACDGTPVTDQRLRRCYSFTVNLRNPRA
ncbi:MAG: PilW family protein [Proteobacteria bacterium]|nr:PilW family protein [Pseudomonadota bacterium]